MDAVEHFVVLAPLLAHKRAPITAPWSTCELKLTGAVYQELLRQTLALPRFRFDRFFGEQAVVHIALSYQATQRELAGDGARRLVDDFAAKIALAFNYHEENLPCFNWGTREFPWRQFISGWRR